MKEKFLNRKNILKASPNFYFDPIEKDWEKDTLPLTFMTCLIDTIFAFRFLKMKMRRGKF